MDIIQRIAKELETEKWRVEAAVRLIDGGNTIPFIARYRKEATGSLDDEKLRRLSERLAYFRSLEERKAQALLGVKKQGKLTEELRRRISEAEALVEVEDLYRPYRPKKRTRASAAREKGLAPLAELILRQEIKEPLSEAARAYAGEGKGADTEEAAIKGALDIIAEEISDEAAHREYIRRITAKKGRITAEARDGERPCVYERYYHFEEAVRGLAGHKILAVNRGEKEKFLTVRLKAPDEEAISYLERQVIRRENPYTASFLKEAAKDSYKRLIAPAIEREIRNQLTQRAQEGAVGVFGKNLKQLLMQPPVVGRTVLGWDPAFRTGCKLAVADPTGKVLETAVIYPTAPTTPQKKRAAADLLRGLIEKYGITLISLGNGTASRESEQFIAEFLKGLSGKVRYVIVNEAGASVYSAGKLAAEEFPHFDVGQRSAASIARRLQDPLAELVKLEPQSIGVGQYQHDMNQRKLKEALSGVVEDCVNRVGVDVNTASASLLSYVSGITDAVAKNIVIYREKNGEFKERKELLKVEKLGGKAYEQCAGFLRIFGGKNPLDGTSVHPEAYEAAKKLLKRQGFTLEDIKKGGIQGFASNLGDYEEAAKELGIGEITLRDIAKELEKPARDPREELQGPTLRTDVLDIKDLKEGMLLKGTVRNVIDFGVFVDIGVHQDGLVHISEITDKKFIRHPLEAVSVGDIVDVRVMSVDIGKKRIQLTMKGLS